MWASIAADDLSNTLGFPGCSDGGIATEWTARTLDSGATLALGPGQGIAFVTDLPGAAVPVPALTPWALGGSPWPWRSSDSLPHAAGHGTDEPQVRRASTRGSDSYS